MFCSALSEAADPSIVNLFIPFALDSGFPLDTSFSRTEANHGNDQGYTNDDNYGKTKK